MIGARKVKLWRAAMFQSGDTDRMSLSRLGVFLFIFNKCFGPYAWLGSECIYQLTQFLQVLVVHTCLWASFCFSTLNVFVLSYNLSFVREICSLALLFLRDVQCRTKQNNENEKREKSRFYCSQIHRHETSKEAREREKKIRCTFSIIYRRRKNLREGKNIRAWKTIHPKSNMICEIEQNRKKENSIYRCVS